MFQSQHTAPGPGFGDLVLWWPGPGTNTGQSRTGHSTSCLQHNYSVYKWKIKQQIFKTLVNQLYKIRLICSSKYEHDYLSHGLMMKWSKMNLTKPFVRARVLIGCYISLGSGIFWEFPNLPGLGLIRGGDTGPASLSSTHICSSFVSWWLISSVLSSASSPLYRVCW